MGRTRKYKRYNPEFKREALKRASEDGIKPNAHTLKTNLIDHDRIAEGVIFGAHRAYEHGVSFASLG